MFSLLTKSRICGLHVIFMAQNDNRRLDVGLCRNDKSYLESDADYPGTSKKKALHNGTLQLSTTRSHSEYIYNDK